MNQEPDLPIELPVITNPKESLNYTQRLRMMMVARRTRNGTKVDDDPESIEVLRALLNDIDKQTLAELKIKSDNQNADDNRRVAIMVANLNKQIHGDPNRVEPIDGTVERLLDFDIPQVELAPGETAIGLESETIADFRAKTE